MLLLRIDTTMLSFLNGEREVGFYSAAYRLVESPQFISWALGAAMLPWLTRAGAGADLGRGFELGLKAMNAVLLPIGLVLVLFAEPIVDLLYGDGYAAAVLPLQLLGATTVLFGVQKFASIAFIARGNPGMFARVVALVVVVNVSVNVVVIPRYGADGAAGAALLSSVVLALACLALAQRAFGPIRFVRCFAGPVAGGLAAVALQLALDLPLLPGVIAALAVYALTLAATERLAFRDDATVFAGALSGARWSRARAGRPAA